MHQAIDWYDARVRAVRDVAADVRLFDIEPVGRPATAVLPGSHINVTVYVDGRPDVRSYSLVGPAIDGGWRIAVKRMPDSRGGSVYMWSLAPGARLAVSAPANHFPLATGSPDYLLVAGGIGITPIYGMALTLAATGARFRLLYGARRRADLAFVEDLRQRVGDRLEVFVDEEGTPLDLGLAIDGLAPDGELYICGPIGMLEAARRLWRDRGRPLDTLRFETFGNTGRLPNEPFVVHIPRLGLDIAVPANRTLLSALEDAGVAMISDCRRGECGLCTVDVLACDGEVDHRDVFFSDRQKAENKRLCACVSRVAGGGITIDTADRAE